MGKLLSWIGWLLVAVAGAGAFAWLALSRGEQVSAAWLVTAAVCTYLIAYRFYSRFIASKIFALDGRQRSERQLVGVHGVPRIPLRRSREVLGECPLDPEPVVADGERELVVEGGEIRPRLSDLVGPLGHRHAKSLHRRHDHRFRGERSEYAARSALRRRGGLRV